MAPGSRGGYRSTGLLHRCHRRGFLTEFIEPVPLRQYPGPPLVALTKTVKDDPRAATVSSSQQLSGQYWTASFFGDTLDDVKQARFFLMRPVVRVVDAMLLMLSVAERSPDATRHTGMDTPRLREFHRQMVDGAGEADPLASVEGQFLYAKVWLNEALHSMKTSRFARPLRYLS